MASLYLKRGMFYVTWGHGRDKQYRALGLREDERERAVAIKESIERGLKADKAAGVADTRTVRGYRMTWTERRIAQNITTAHDDDVRLRKHAAELGPMLLSEVRVRHVREVLLRLRAKGELANRSIHHVYGALHNLFQSALEDELVTTNPVTATRGSLPPKTDAEPGWRPTAVFSREEVERLMSDPLVPRQRQVLYTLLLTTGMRIGEAAALQWRAYNPEMKPLGQISVSQSFNRKLKKVKGVKTEVPRLVPVHPALARALYFWRTSEWSEYRGVLDPPAPHDLILPTFRGDHLKDPVVHANLLRDLGKLGVRDRRTHDARRSFISLALADGASREILRWVTHGPPGDIMSLYTTLPWDSLCREVGKLNILAGLGPTALLPTAKKDV